MRLVVAVGMGTMGPLNCWVASSAFRNIANDIIAMGRKDTAQYGGFSSQAGADASRSGLLTLAKVLYAVVPRAAAMANRSMPIPGALLRFHIYIYIHWFIIERGRYPSILLTFSFSRRPK
jgi:hypothetical protein